MVDPSLKKTTLKKWMVGSWKFLPFLLGCHGFFSVRTVSLRYGTSRDEIWHLLDGNKTQL